MREIKFRAWDKHQKKMIPVPRLLFGDDGSSLTLMVWTKVTKHDYMLTVGESCELMQYTGLKDKNGKEIYEGDIVRLEKNNYQIIWNEYECKFCLLSCKYNDLENLADSDDENKKDMYFNESLGNFEGNYCKIVGNIYENPELLKGKE